MFGIIIGLLLGVLISLIVFVAGLFISDLFRSWEATRICNIITAVICVVILIGSSILGYSIECHENRKWLTEFVAVKETIESSLRNENISGLERIELVKQASEKNAELAKRAYNSEQWYGFTEAPNLKDVEPINLEVSHE